MRPPACWRLRLSNGGKATAGWGGRPRGGLAGRSWYPLMSTAWIPRPPHIGRMPGLRSRPVWNGLGVLMWNRAFKTTDLRELTTGLEHERRTRWKLYKGTLTLGEAGEDDGQDEYGLDSLSNAGRGTFRPILGNGRIGGRIRLRSMARRLPPRISIWMLRRPGRESPMAVSSS